LTTLIPVLGDQLSINLPSLADADKKNTVVLLTECMEEATYIKHHQKKLVFVFSCMRHFGALLESKGWRVDYIKLTDKGCPKSIPQSITRAVKKHACTSVVMTEAVENSVYASAGHTLFV
jgi:deoxyribodipyrimidine photolyase-related protein